MNYRSISNISSIVITIAALVGLYFTTWVNYLLFHTLAEGYSIVVAFSFSMITWNARRFIQNPYLLFIGIAFLFISSLDILHTLSYKGMPIFTDYAYYGNQLWIGARYMESITLLAAFIFLKEDVKKLNIYPIIFLYLVVTTIIICSIFVWKTFPVCFVEGVGLTPFKKNSEYIIIGFLLLSLIYLKKHSTRFDRKVIQLILLSIICTIISELAFTFYIDNYGLSNLIGHYFKIFSFVCIYRAIIKTAIEKPYELIFHDLEKSNHLLSQEIEVRKKIEQDKETLITNLQTALEEIKTLKGILPICMHCKKIRDDQGYWNQLEKYIHEHSDAAFSHSICPDCLKEHYPSISH